jgi:hypothetical protein
MTTTFTGGNGSTFNLSGLTGHFQLAGGNSTVVVNDTSGIQITDMDASSSDNFSGSNIDNSTFNLGGGNDTADFGTIVNSTVNGGLGDDRLTGLRSFNTTYNGGSNTDFIAAKYADSVTGQRNFFVGGSGGDVFELPIYNRLNGQATVTTIVQDFADGLDLISVPTQIYERQGFTGADQYVVARVRLTNLSIPLGAGTASGVALSIGTDPQAIMFLRGVNASQLTTADFIPRFSPVA